MLQLVSRFWSLPDDVIGEYVFIQSDTDKLNRQCHQLNLDWREQLLGVWDQLDRPSRVSHENCGRSGLRCTAFLLAFQL